MKHLPSYAREIVELRKLGRVPTKQIIVTFNWKIGKSYPRIVISNKHSIHDFEFSFLAGLPVQIVHDEKDACKVTDLITEIMKVKPIWLATFGLHLVGGENPAFTILHDELSHGLREVA